MEECRNAGGKVLTYGSYNLGVHSRGNYHDFFFLKKIEKLINFFFIDADIDTLCVIPNLVTREEFFDEMSNFLLSNHRVHDLNVVKDSFVPVIKFKYDDISVSYQFLICIEII